MSTKKIAPSLLASDFCKLADEIHAVESAGADWLHVDVMDGHFVPNLTIGPPVIERIKKVAKIPLDVHLMISNPDASLEQYVQAGADWVSVHPETCPHLHRTLARIRELGAKAAVALNPHTPLESIRWVLAELDMVLLMSVNPGFGGQRFIPSALEKARVLERMRKENNLNFLIEMDGGIKTENIAEISQAGVDVFVVGSGIFGTGDYRKTIEGMKSRI